MRRNEYNSLEEFKSEYTGIRSPADNLWHGLDFNYLNKSYRLHTGPMYNTTDTILPDGRQALFGVYIHDPAVVPWDKGYTRIGEYADMESLLENCVIDGRKFKDVIMDENTEITGKD